MAVKVGPDGGWGFVLLLELSRHTQSLPSLGDANHGRNCRAERKKGAKSKTQRNLSLAGGKLPQWENAYAYF